MTDYDELVREMREAAANTPNAMRRTDALHAGAVAIAALVQKAAEVPVANTADTELRREAAGLAIAASSSLGDSATPNAAAQWLAFLQDGANREPRPKGEWDLPTIQPDEDQREHLERVVGSALGAASTAWTGTPTGVFESSYVSGIVDVLMEAIDGYAGQRGGEIARGPLPVEVGGNGLLPVGTQVEVTRESGETSQGVIEMVDPDVYYVRTEDGRGATYHPAARTRMVALPKPEDTTPRVGDTVRVREGAAGTDRLSTRARCVGEVGVLNMLRPEGRGYRVHHEDGAPSLHSGPLSDFELVERAKVGD